MVDARLSRCTGVLSAVPVSRPRFFGALMERHPTVVDGLHDSLKALLNFFLRLKRKQLLLLFLRSMLTKAQNMEQKLLLLL